MRALSLEDFTASIGQPYLIGPDEAPFALMLEDAAPLPGSPRDGGGFRLDFCGPAEPMLPQATYSLRRGEEAFDIFIVAIGCSERGTLYEAIFS